MFELYNSPKSTYASLQQNKIHDFYCINVQMGTEENLILPQDQKVGVQLFYFIKNWMLKKKMGTFVFIYIGIHPCSRLKCLETKQNDIRRFL